MQHDELQLRMGDQITSNTTDEAKNSAAVSNRYHIAQ